MKIKILGLLEKGGNAHSISKSLRRRRATIVQHLNELKKLGLTNKESHFWHITKLGKQVFNSSSGNEGGRFSLVGCERGGVGTTDWLQRDRAHNLKIKVSVSEKPLDNNWLVGWESNDEIKNNVFYRKRFGDILVTYTGKSLIFQLPVLKFKDAEIAVAEAGKIGIALCKKYEAEIPGLKLGGYDIKAQLISQHHAIPFEPFSKWLYENGICYKDDILDIDASDSPELEFTDSEKAHIHHTNYIDHIKDVVLQKEPVKPSDIAKAVHATQQQLYEIAKGQINTNTQLQTLIKVLSPKPVRAVSKEDKLRRVSYIG